MSSTCQYFKLKSFFASPNASYYPRRWLVHVIAFSSHRREHTSKWFWHLVYAYRHLGYEDWDREHSFSQDVRGAVELLYIHVSGSHSIVYVHITSSYIFIFVFEFNICIYVIPKSIYCFIMASCMCVYACQYTEYTHTHTHCMYES